MICRHMKKATDEDIEKFDYFNDFKDTSDWLKVAIRYEENPTEKENLEKILDKLTSGDKEFWSTYWNRNTIGIKV